MTTDDGGRPGGESNPDDGDQPDDGGQLALVRARVRRTRARPSQAPAPSLPIARVAVDTPLAHLDRPFDYTVPERMHETCVPGCRVRVRFAGQDLDGYVLDRVAESAHRGRLAPLRRVVSAEPVLAPEVARLARSVADRYAGTLADVLRLAVPPRHARVEGESRPAHVGEETGRAGADRSEPAAGDEPADRPAQHEPAGDADHGATRCEGPWGSYEAGPAYLQALRRGDAPRAVWSALPGEDWPRALATAAAVTLAGGRGVLIVVPDHRDVARLDAACAEVLGAGQHVVLTAELGPAERYRRFLAVRRGSVRCVVGTRAAAFAPVEGLGLVGCWDDGDDLLAEPRAPYPHAREVLLLRAHEQRCGALVGGYACTAEAAQLLATGWAHPVAGSRSTVRARAPRVSVAGESAAELARDPAARAVRLPHRAFEVARQALTTGPVLVQVPRSGYLPALACQNCRAAARCTACAGPVQQSGGREIPACGWCGRPAVAWRCPTCEGTRMRAPVIGARRTAEELGRAFPRVPVRTSGGQRVLESVGAEPALVVATPGAEPLPAEGYAAALMLDTWLALARADLRAGEETLRRWLNAAALVRGADQGGAVVVMGEPSVPSIQALVRWSPVAHAERELADRRIAGFPPTVRLAVIEGDGAAVSELTEFAELPETAEVLGPVPHGEDDGVRMVIRTPRRDGVQLAEALKTAQASRSARKSAGTARVQIDPIAFG
ncbi:primosomal protein N' [Actinopolymorpha sp. B11F2]|uniref:primosomal protein N' n=1 Tax=Actinopolymorpha sp. B11F2 TaxID=3160862 RepID=UPI0032E41E2E